MAHAVFTTSVGSIYDDLPEFRYHFPRTYLNQARAAEGDWIIYYEPRRSQGGGRQSYFAVAKVRAVRPDPDRNDHHYAYMEGFLAFDRPVPFQNGGSYYEPILQKGDGSSSRGAFGRAVRALSDESFDAILKAGFTRDLAPWEITDRMGVAEDVVAYSTRPMVEQVLTRPFREEAFRRRVREVYGNTCAVSGLRLINGGGRPEVQAAHIRPVASDGPDSIRNGLALTGTLHWAFDRGLISVAPDLTLLLSPQGLPDDLARLLRPDRRLAIPQVPQDQPHPSFLAWHREHVFKQ